MRKRTICMLTSAFAVLLGSSQASVAGLIIEDQLRQPLAVDGNVIRFHLNDDLELVAAVDAAAPDPIQAQEAIDFNAAAAAVEEPASSPSSPSPPPGGKNPVGGSRPIKGDVNEDDVVNMLDFFIIQNNFNQTVSSRSEGDLNNDGQVNMLDFFELQNHFGDFFIPEPRSVVVFAGCLLVAGTVIGIRRTNKRDVTPAQQRPI